MAIVLDGTAGITTPDLTDTSLTSGRVVYAGTSGNLTGSDNLTFSGTSLTLKTGYYEAYDPVDATSAGVGMRFYTDGGGTKTENGRLAVSQTATSGSLSSMIFQTNSGTSLGEKMRLTGAGSLCVGSTSAGDAGTVTVSIGNPGTTAGGLQLWASSAQEHYIQWGDSSTGSATYAGAISYAHATNSMRFWTNSTERTRIDSSGQIFWGCTGAVPASMYFTPDANGGSLVSSGSSGSKFVFYFQHNNGTVGYIASNSGGTSYNTSSDYRLKNTIAPMTGALAKVALLKPVTYKWNADGSDGEGFIAHELAEVCPYAVTGEKDALDANGNIKPQGIDVSFLVATLTAAIQEQQALITTLTERITALEGA
tara:strand:- start:977 stop:2077 length:1101 start_codon:yes stop_codon:yes gene_type:complete